MLGMALTDNLNPSEGLHPYISQSGLTAWCTRFLANER